MNAKHMLPLAFAKRQDEVEPIEDELEQAAPVDAPNWADVGARKPVGELQRKDDLTVLGTTDERGDKRHVVGCAKDNRRRRSRDLRSDELDAAAAFKMAVTKRLPVS